MKNAAIAVLLLAVAVLVGAKHQEPVTSISFDGGKTRIHGDVNIRVEQWQGNAGHDAFARYDQQTNTVTFDVADPFCGNGNCSFNGR